MQNTLLNTKLNRPIVPDGCVVRGRLHERLRAGLAGKLTLVSAPTGFGKTTLVSNWSSHVERPFAWLTLDESDNDLVRFFRNLVAALRTVKPSLGQGVLARFDAPQIPPLGVLLSPMVNEVANVSEPFVLVLDDYHMVSNRFIHEALVYLLENSPPLLHLIILTRIDPPFALSHLRIQRALTEIRTSDLRFSQQEAVAFFNQMTALSLTLDHVAAIVDQVDGRGAGLLLAAQALHDRRDVEEFVDSLHESQSVSDDLAEEVLRRQPKNFQSFLLKTSVLGQMCAPLCDSILGPHLPKKLRDTRMPAVAKFQDVFENLVRTHFFLAPMDNDRLWYRYHHFFTAFLRAQSEGLDVKDVHQKAAQWYLDNGYPSGAIHHALVVGDTEQACKYILAGVDQALEDREVANLLNWIDALPDAFVRTTDALAVAKGWALYRMWQMEAAESYAASAQASLSPDTPAATRGRLAGLRAHLALDCGNFDRALEYSEKTLEMIGEEVSPLRVGTLLVLAEVQNRVGLLQDASESYRLAEILSRDLQAYFTFARAIHGLAQLKNIMGERLEAIAMCQEALRACVDAEGNSLPIAGVIDISLGILYYEGDCLPMAREHLMSGIELCQPTDAPSLFVGKLYLAKVQQVMGEEIGALVTLQEARQMTGAQGSMLDERDLAMVEADIYMQQGNFAAAYDWADKVREKVGDSLRISDSLLFSRLLLTQNNPTEADILLKKVVRLTRQTGRTRELLTALILRSLANQALGYAQEAKSLLEEAVQLAAPQGYSRAFLDEWTPDDAGHSYEALLDEGRGTAPEFIADLFEKESTWGSQAT